jgi:outer membrane protein assembly factor BamB
MHVFKTSHVLAFACLLAGSASAIASAAEWQVRIPSTTQLPPAVQQALILQDGTFLITGGGLTRHFDADLGLLGTYTVSTSVGLTTSSAVVDRTGGIQYPDVSPLLAPYKSHQAADPNELCRFDRKPWGDELKFSHELTGRFAHGARPLRPGLFGLYETSAGWQIAHFGADCGQRKLLVVAEGDAGVLSSNYYDNRDVVASHDGESAFVRIANWDGMRMLGFHIGKLDRTGLLWTYSRVLPEAGSTSSPLFESWSIEPTRDGGVLVFDGRQLERITAAGQSAWIIPVTHTYRYRRISLSDLREDTLDFARPLLADLGEQVSLEFNDKRFIYSRAGELLAQQDLSDHVPPLPAKILLDPSAQPVLSGQNRILYSQTTNFGSWALLRRHNSLLWYFDAFGHQVDLIAPDSGRGNIGFIGGGKLLQVNSAAETHSVLDPATLTRQDIPELPREAFIGMFAVHLAGDFVFVTHGESQGQLLLSKLSKSGELLWTVPVAGPLEGSVYDPHGVVNHRPVLASSDHRICALFALGGAKLACFDTGSGERAFETVSLPQIVILRGSSGNPVQPDAAILATLADQSVVVIGRIPDPPTGYQSVRHVRLQLDALGQLVTEEPIGTELTGVSPTSVAADDARGRFLTSRARPDEESGTQSLCPTETQVTRHRIDGSFDLSLDPIDGAWFAQGLADDGRMLLGSCDLIAVEPQLLALAADGRELWRIPHPARNTTPKLSLSNGDWLFLDGRELVRVSGRDGSVIWRSVVLQWDASAWLPVNLFESSSLVVVQHSIPIERTTAWRIADGAPAAALSPYQTLGTPTVADWFARSALALSEDGQAIAILTELFQNSLRKV